MRATGLHERDFYGEAVPHVRRRDGLICPIFMRVECIWSILKQEPLTRMPARIVAEHRQACRVPAVTVIFPCRLPDRVRFRASPTIGALNRYLSLAVLAGLAACSSARESEPDRTATEQLLFSVAAERAVERLPLDIPAETKVFVNPAYVEGTDSKFLLGALRSRVLRQGAALVDSKPEADLVLEPRVGAISLDRGNTLIGTPDFGVPIPLVGEIPIPELALYKRDTQQGVINLAATSYDQTTGKLVQDLPSVYGFSHKTEWVALLLFSWSSNDLMPERPKETWVGD